MALARRPGGEKTADALERDVDPPAGQDQVGHRHVAHEADEPVLQRLGRAVQSELLVVDGFAVAVGPLDDAAQVEQRKLAQVRGELVPAAGAPHAPQ